MSVANRVIKNTIWLYVKVGVQLFTTLLATRIVLNTLGASDFGIFNIVGGAIAMLGFLNTSMAVATQRFMSYSEGEGTGLSANCFWVSFSLYMTWGPNRIMSASGPYI